MCAMSSQASSGPGGLRAGALRIGNIVIISMASSGPTQSIAVTLAVLLATVGYASFLPIVICLIPILGIAIGYQRLNAWQPSAGATYSWVGRALNPHAGFFAGWIMLMYYCVGTTSLTVPLGTYMLSFFSTSAANTRYAVAAVGTAFDILVLVIAALGIKLSARFPWGWAIFEYGLLVGFSIAAIVGIYGHHLHHTVKISSSWFTIGGAGGFSALVSGLPAGHLPVLRLGHRRLRQRGGQGQAGRPGRSDQRGLSCSSSTRASSCACRASRPTAPCRTTRATSWPTSAT